jgi:hypothetical protein
VGSAVLDATFDRKELEKIAVRLVGAAPISLLAAPSRPAVEHVQWEGGVSF